MHHTKFYSTANFTPIFLQINCGYARTAIRELTPKCKHQVTPSTNEHRKSEFQKLFGSFSLPHNEMTENAKGLIPFDIHCDKVLTAFSKRWNPSQARLNYEKQFSIANWRALMKNNRSIPFLIA